MKKVWLTLMVLLMVLAAHPAIASEGHSRWKDLKFITTDELKKLYDAKGDFVLIDTLSSIEYAEEHIKGAVNLPYEQVKSGKAKLPADRNRTLIFYCKGPKCSKSKKTAALAVKMGYRNVHVYDEGIPEWMKRGYPAEVRDVYPKGPVGMISVQELKGMLDSGEDVVVVDLRDSEDRAAGWIKGSRHIDMDVLDDLYSQIPKNKKVVLACLHGKQSPMAGRFLLHKGFSAKNVYRLDGGMISGWMKAGFPVEK